MGAHKIAFMSQEEQDAILGRATREYGELQRSLTLIDLELESLADNLGGLIGYVNRRVRLAGDPESEKLPAFPDAISKYLDASRLTALLGEQDRLLKRIRSARLTLNQFG